MTSTDPIVAANRLTAAWAGRHKAGPTVLSGAGVWVLLALLTGGATGKVREDLEEALRLPAADALDGARCVLGALQASRAVRTAAAVWAQETPPLEPSWLSALPPGTIRRFTEDDDPSAIDRWVEQVTDGQIRAVPGGIDPALAWVPISVLAMRTQWVQPFEPRPEHDPSEGPWAGLPAAWLSQLSTDLDRLKVGEGPAGPFTMLRVEGTEDVDVHLVLGTADAVPGMVLETGITALNGGVALIPGSQLPGGEAGPGVTVRSSSATSPCLDVTTAAFTVTATHNLRADAELFGLAAVSQAPAAHFPGITPQPLVLDQARQDATMEFTHEGCRATAVTRIGMLLGRVSPSVRWISVAFDRPFGFAAVHRPTGLVLLAGWVHQPSIAAEATRFS